MDEAFAICTTYHKGNGDSTLGIASRKECSIPAHKPSSISEIKHAKTQNNGFRQRFLESSIKRLITQRIVLEELKNESLTWLNWNVISPGFSWQIPSSSLP